MAFIAVRKGTRKKLEDMFKLNKSTVSEALNFNTHSLNARRIRFAACNLMGGKYINFPK